MINLAPNEKKPVEKTAACRRSGGVSRKAGGRRLLPEAGLGSTSKNVPQSR